MNVVRLGGLFIPPVCGCRDFWDLCDLWDKCRDCVYCRDKLWDLIGFYSCANKNERERKRITIS